jgi:hypothetical protein
MRKLFFCFLAIASANGVFADEPKFDAKSRAQAITPYLDEQTVVVAHIDVSVLNLDAILAAIPGVSKRDADELAALKTNVAPWLADFTNAGAKELYIVFSLADYRGTPFVIVPTSERTNADVLVRLFRSRTTTDLLKSASFHLAPEVVEKLDQAVFAGGSKALARIKGGKPAERPELAKAFAAVGDTTAQVLVLPTASARRVIEEVVPSLPKEVGGGPMTIVTRGFQWGAIGVGLPPKTALRVVIQSKDASAARALRDVIGEGVDRLSREALIREAVPEYDKLAPRLKPTIADDRLVLSFEAGSAGLSDLLAAFAPKITESGDRRQCMQNLHLIGIALHNYHDVYTHFPAVANFDKNGRPLLSWRVHILPFVNQDALYKQFHLDEPWDSEHNKKLIERMPDVYRCPNMKRKLVGKTTYLAPVGDSLMFTGTKDGVQMKEISDGTSNTIFIVDADDDHAVTWTKPDDLRIGINDPAAGLVGHHPGGFNALFADASVHFINRTIDPKVLWALFTRNGGEVVSPNP